MSSPQKRSLYEAWVRDHAAGLYRCALRMTGRRDAAEELVQETFYEAWRSIDSLRAPAKARSWLLGILRHRYAHWVRDQTRSPQSASVHENEVGELTSGELPVEVLARQEAIQAALNELDDRHKLPFLLVFLEGMTCQQAADMLDVPLGTVLSRIHRARQFLRSRLAGGEDDPALKRRYPAPAEEPESGAGGQA